VSKYKAFRLAAIAAVIAGPLTAAMATNGYFSHGYGMKAKGMGGASVAMTDNAFAGANNPAAAATAGNRAELGLDLFMPEREASSSAGAAAKSDSNLFYVPEFGYNRTVSDKLGVNLTVYGNGGMNTDYGTNLLGGTGRLGVDLMQLIIAPTVGYKLSDKHSVGVSALLVHQQFKAEGLSGLGLSNQGYDTSNGFGVRLGYLGKLNDTVSLGASYSPKIDMSKFSKYKGLFAEQGDFDIPENYTLGLAMQATPSVTVALDYQRINYSGVRAISNPSANMLIPAPLGADNGPGFGWTDVNVWKLGAQWQATPQLTMRAGVNVGDNPIKSADATFNILAPGVVTTHYTLGGTYALSKDTEVTMSYMYAPSNSVTGANLMGPGTHTIKMSQQSLGVQFGWKF
jgi:long-chain fatty acid transport protein